MSEVVERLTWARDRIGTMLKDFGGGKETVALLSEAIDEIGRLTAINAELVDALGRIAAPDPDDVSAEVSLQWVKIQARVALCKARPDA